MRRERLIDEVFIGSCMTNIGHYRAAAKVLEGQGTNEARLWVVPPTRMDEEMLQAEGYYAIFEQAGSRMEMPGCSLCMGNQARVEDNTTVFSTSTRNFNNRLGNGAQVYLGSAELAAVCAQLGRIPTKEQYLAIAAAKINPQQAEIYRYLNFDQLAGFEDQGRVVSSEEEAKVLAGCEIGIPSPMVGAPLQGWCPAPERNDGILQTNQATSTCRLPLQDERSRPTHP
jgi:aconitate hydratase 2/2-methylisocitrate dehydratase